MNLNRIREYSKYIKSDKVAKEFIADIIAVEEEIRKLEYREKTARKSAEDLYIKIGRLEVN